MISLTAGQSQRIVFPVETAGTGMLEVPLKPEGFDSLASDDIAYLDLPVGRPLAVFCPPSWSHSVAPCAATKTSSSTPRTKANPKRPATIW